MIKLDETKLDLRKKIVLDLKKDMGIESEKAQVVLALDYSGSMDHLYRNGTVQELLERMLALAIQFDDDGSVPFYLFHDGYKKPADITINSITTIVADVMKKYEMGGTNYAPVIKGIMKDLLPSAGIFSKGYSKTPLDTPVYVIFVTDGQCGDSHETEKLIKEASAYGIFFQFVGIGHARFDFLEMLDDMPGRVIDNANFLKVPNLSTTPDHTLYSLLLAEYPSWLKLARTNNIIK